MKKREQCKGPVLFAMCIGILSVLCSCSRGNAYQFESVGGTAAGSMILTESASADAAPGTVTGSENAGQSSEELAADPPEPEMIWVYVCGAVKSESGSSSYRRRTDYRLYGG